MVGLPALECCLIGFAGVDPSGVGAGVLFLPEGRSGFEVVHHEIGGIEGGVPVV